MEKRHFDGLITRRSEFDSRSRYSPISALTSNQDEVMSAEKVDPFPNIEIKRYSEKMPVWEGYISPDHGRWILFIDRLGDAHLYDVPDSGEARFVGKTEVFE